MVGRIDIDGMRRALREGDEPSLWRRRALATLSAVGMADFAIISLYQLGAIRRLPDLPGRWMDSNRVNASRKAYRLGVPDGPLGALFYAAVVSLTAVGGTRRTVRPRALEWLLGALVVAGVVSALDYLRDMIFEEKRACPYCLVGAALNVAMVPHAWREIRNSA